VSWPENLTDGDTRSPDVLFAYVSFVFLQGALRYRVFSSHYHVVDSLVLFYFYGFSFAVSDVLVLFEITMQMGKTTTTFQSPSPQVRPGCN
jgi:hypothetical protein